jgi:flagellar assembly protein FliH
LSRQAVSAPLNVAPFESVLTPAEAQLAALRDGNRAGIRGLTAVQRLRDAAYAEGLARGREEGVRQGIAEGRELAYAELQGHVAEFGAALDAASRRVDAAVEDWAQRAEDALAGLAVAIAARIIGKEVSVDPSITLRWAQEAIKEVTHADRIRIRLNPFDAPIIRENASMLQALAPSVLKVEICEDDGIEGGCRIESDGGVIDATIRSQLNLALESMRGEE